MKLLKFVMTLRIGNKQFKNVFNVITENLNR